MSINRKSLFGVIKSFCVVLAVLAWVLSVSSAYAKHTGVPPSFTEVSINGMVVFPEGNLPCLDGEVSISGLAVTAAPPGRAEQVGLLVNWGDGSEQVLERPTELMVDPPKGNHVDVDLTFGDPPLDPVVHKYVVSGTYTITLTIFHTNKSGADATADAILAFEICIFEPQDATLLVNAVESFDCLLGDPLEGTVTLFGGGKGVATSDTASVEDFQVQIDWGDLSEQLLVRPTEAMFTPAIGDSENFDYEFGIAPLLPIQHTYVDNGTYTATVSLVFPDPLLPGSLSVAAFDTIEICIFNPVLKTLDVDLINGVPPDGSCLEGQVALVASGQGFVPPGDIADLEVSIDWGDETSPELLTASSTITPFGGVGGGGVHTNFDVVIGDDPLNPVEHTYTEIDTYTAIVTVFYFDPLLGTNQTVLSTTTDICILLPAGIVTGLVTEIDSGLPIVGAVVEDIGFVVGGVFTAEPAIPGSFPALNNYVVNTEEGLRRIRVSATGFVPLELDVPVLIGETTVQNFELSLEDTGNILIYFLTLPIGPVPSGSGGDPPPSQLNYLPLWVEALLQGQVVQISTVRVGPSYVFVNLPLGKMLFRAESSYYTVGNAEVNNNQQRASRDQSPIKHIQIPTDVPEAPEARASVITGSISGSTTLLGAPIGATVEASFTFEDVPVTVTIPSDGVTGDFQMDLLDPGATGVVAYASINLSPTFPTTVVGGEVHTVGFGFPDPPPSVPLAPFDEVTANFVPQVESPSFMFTDEDIPRVVAIAEFGVTDFDNTFPGEHTLELGPGFGYTLSDILPGSTQLNPDPNTHGSVVVPVTVSDGTNTSTAFVLTVNIDSVPDPIVYVDLDTGDLLVDGGTGGQDKPLLTISEAFSEVTAGGTVRISGLVESREKSLRTIDEPVVLENNNPGNPPTEVVTIRPKKDEQRQAGTDPQAESGFVTRSGRPRSR